MESKIIDIIYTAIDEINLLRPNDKKIPKSPESLLYGRNGVLDSLGILNLAIAIETKFEENDDTIISLAENISSMHKNNPFESITTLIEYIKSQL